jgi:hypothetical protein
MSDMTPIDRAQKAKAVLESPIFSESFDLVRERLIQGLEALPTADVQGAESFRLCLKLLKSVRLNLETAINTGKLELFRLNEEEKRKKNPLRGIFR